MSSASEVLEGLARQQRNGTLCDVELQAEYQTIHAHKSVLAASTPYFEAMFLGKFEETNARTVEVKGVTFAGLKGVVDCIYTSSIDIGLNNINDILPAAHLMQMTGIVKQCEEWMEKTLAEDNCFHFLRLAEKYNIEKIEKNITDFVLKNFVVVSKTEEFGEISQQALCRYISSDLLKTGMDENSVFKAARSWILKNDVKDKEVIFEIMKNVRFAFIPPITLSSEVLVDDLIEGNREFRMMVAEAMKYHADVYNQPFYEGGLNKPRGEKGQLIVATQKRIGNKFSTAGEGEVHFTRVSTLYKAEQDKSLGMAIVYESMNAITINNFLFLFGIKCNGYQNFAMRYDASNDSWMDLAAVTREATVGSAIACSEDKKDIFLVGGMVVKSTSKYDDGDNTIITSYVNNYNVQTNTWSLCKLLPIHLMYSAAATLHDHIYVTGGQAREGVKRTVYAYDTKGKLWLTKAKMNKRRREHILLAIREKLYAIGGESDRHLVTCIDTYDPLSDQWTIALTNGPSTSGASSLVMKNIIYILGGSGKVICAVDVNNKKVLGNRPGVHQAFCESHVSVLMTLPKLL